MLVLKMLKNYLQRPFESSVDTWFHLTQLIDWIIYCFEGRFRMRLGNQIVIFDVKFRQAYVKSTYIVKD